MLKKHSIKSYLLYSVAAALLYSIFSYLFIHNQTFRSSWILYIGNALFGCCIAVFVIFYNKKRRENASTATMIGAGHITTAMGVIIACIISLLFLLFMPHASSHLQQSEVLNNAPPQMESGKTHQFVLSLFMNAIIGNVSFGSFVSLIISYAAKRDQKGGTSTKISDEPSTKTTDEPELLNQNKA